MKDQRFLIDTRKRPATLGVIEHDRHQIRLAGQSRKRGNGPALRMAIEPTTESSANGLPIADRIAHPSAHFPTEDDLRMIGRSHAVGEQMTKNP